MKKEKIMSNTKSQSGIIVPSKMRFSGEEEWLTPEDFEIERLRRLNIKNRKKKFLKLIENEK